MQSDSSNKRVKIFGGILAVVALAVVGVVALSNSGNSAQMMPLERAEALAQIENANVPLSQLPDEADVHIPDGWQVESDEPVEGSEVELDGADELMQDEAREADDDIDSPLDVEEDEEGQKYVAELGENIMVDETQVSLEEGEAVAADGVTPRRCAYKLKKCGYKKACQIKCNKKCKPYAIRKCNVKKFCKCYCKYYGKIKQAKKCVYYKRKACRTALTYKCKRGCKKYCKRVPRCYCCAKYNITKKCRQMCKKTYYKTKCGKCRCAINRCIKKCVFVCKKYKAY